MNAVLILCRQCRRIRGCTEPTEKSCATCASHDCPLLPAPERVEGSCSICRPVTFFDLPDLAEAQAPEKPEGRSFAW